MLIDMHLSGQVSCDGDGLTDVGPGFQYRLYMRAYL